ncbi:MAG: hypothetical protein CNC06_02865 [Pelagibacterales bacterium MED-G40]|nr:MAG: hypothetical protein CNC06_02865 [Pelagibacterales bacterium MED-G40]
MKVLKFIITLLLQVVFFLSIINTIHAKNLSKYQDADKISKYFSGILSFNDNKYANSYDYLRTLEGLEDNHLTYSKLYQYSLINLEKFVEAYRYSKKLEKKGLDSFESNLIIGAFYLKNKRYQNAAKYFKKLNEGSYDQSLEGLLSESLNNWISFKDINNEKAIALIDNINPRFENIKKIQRTFSYCFYGSKLANQEFKKLTINSKTNFARYHFFHANFLYQSGNKKNSIKVIDNSLKMYPGNLILNQLKEDINFQKNAFSNTFDCKNLSHVVAEIFYIVSNALSGQSLYSLSNFYLNLSKYLNPDFASFDALYAENYYMTRNYEKAKKVYKKVKDNGTFYHWHASKQISNILMIEKKEDLAEELLKKAFNIIDDPSIYQIFDYAEFLKNNERYNKSVDYYSKVLSLINKNHYLYPEATDGRGIAYERLGQWKKAEEDLLNSLSVSPDQAYVINYLAYSWIEQGINIEKSLKMLRRANDLKQNDGYIIDSLGWALFKLKNYKEAREYLELAVRIMPSDPIVNDHFADSLWMNDQTIQARYYWNYVLGLEKTESKLKEKIKNKLIFGIK